MSVASVLAAGRRAAESRMVSRCTIYRLDPAHPTTDAGGLEVPSYATVQADVPFRVSSQHGVSRSKLIHHGESEVELALRIGHMPVSVADLRDRDVIAVTSGESAGRFFEVVEGTPADQETARRVPLREIDKPGGIA